MSMREDFLPYRTKSGYLCPNVQQADAGGCDNQTMYTAEYYIMLQRNGGLQPIDRAVFRNLIDNCIMDNMLHRKPTGSGQEGPDDYLGVLNGCKQLGLTTIPRQFLKAIIRYVGFLNNVNPGTMTQESFLLRQPQLVAAMVSAAFPSFKNPLHWLARILAMPFYIIAAISIGIACIGASPTDGDSRRLSWHLMLNTKQTSLMCWIASKIWYRRLFKDFGLNGMSKVASFYYQPVENPYAKWWLG